MEKICVVGLGYVGLPLAVEFGKLRPVIGYDVDKGRVKALAKGVDVTQECTKEQIESATQLSFSSDLSDVADAQVYIVTVPTPIDDAKRPDLTALRSASDAVGRVLREGDFVIFESTVYPGATEEVCVPILESASGLQHNRDFHTGYSPERINPGDKVNTLTKIKKITSGSTPETAEFVDKLYKSIVTAGTWKTRSIRVAEAAKVIENSQRDLNIAFVNELSVIFERLGVDTMEVLEAAGSKWNFMPFRPGMVGGHCIGVDPYYLTHKAEEVGYNPQVILAGRRINDNMGRYVARSVIKKMLQAGVDVARSKVGVLGVTFKENCPDIRNSKVVDLIRELQAWNVDVIVADPWADNQDLKSEYDLELGSIGPEDPVDALIIAVGHNEYRELSPKALLELCKTETPVIGDVKSLYDRDELQQLGCDVFRL